MQATALNNSERRLGLWFGFLRVGLLNKILEEHGLLLRQLVVEVDNDLFALLNKVVICLHLSIQGLLVNFRDLAAELGLVLILHRVVIILVTVLHRRVRAKELPLLTAFLFLF